MIGPSRERTITPRTFRCADIRFSVDSISGGTVAFEAETGSEDAIAAFRDDDEIIDDA